MTRQIAKLHLLWSVLVEEKGAETFFWRKSLIAAEKQEEDGFDFKQLWVQVSNAHLFPFDKWHAEEMDALFYAY